MLDQETISPCGNQLTAGWLYIGPDRRTLTQQQRQHTYTQAVLSALCRRDSVSVGGMLGSKCYYSFLCAADGGAPPDAESIIIIMVMELHGHFPCHGQHGQRVLGIHSPV